MHIDYSNAGPCGAIEVQQPLTEDASGHASEAVVFSAEVTNAFLDRGVLLRDKTPKLQLSGGIAFKECTTVTALIQAVTTWCGHDLRLGVDYEVFSVPANVTCGYFIVPGLAHAFFRGDNFEGVVLRLWWESHGVNSVRKQ